MAIKKLLYSLLIIIFPLLATAQFNNQLIVKQHISGSFVTSVVVSQANYLEQTADEYSVNLELLKLFNTEYSSTEFNSTIIIPLTEVNFIKQSINTPSANYKALYYTKLEYETDIDVAKKFLIPIAVLNKLNNNTQNKELIQVGWLKLSSKPPLVNKNDANQIYSKNATSQDLKQDWKVIQKGIVSTVKKGSNYVKNITTPKPKQANTPLPVFDTDEQVNADTLTNNTVADIDTSFNKNYDDKLYAESTIAKTNKTSTIKQGWNKTKTSIKNGTTQAGQSIQNGTTKVNKSIGNTYNKLKNNITSSGKTKAKNEVIIIEKANQENNNTNAVQNTELVQTQNIEQDKETEMEDAKQPTNDDKLYTNDEPNNVYDILSNNEKEEETIIPSNKNYKGKEVLATANYIFSGAQGAHYVFTDIAPKDSKLILRNTKTNKTVEAIVLSGLTSLDKQDGLQIIISDSAKNILGPANAKFVIGVTPIIN
jgi:hypothetical protein